MSNHIAHAQQCIASLAQRHGIDNLTMNDDGEAVLDFEGREVYLFADARLPLLHVHATVCPLDEDAHNVESILESLLEANLFADKLADAWFAYSRQMEAVLLNKRIELTRPEALDGPLDDFLRIYQSALDAYDEA